MADRFEHIFPGDHALGGVRHTKQGLRAWFQRLYSVHPQLRFEIKHIASSGAPWDTTVVIEWRDLRGHGRRRRVLSSTTACT